MKFSILIKWGEEERRGEAPDMKPGDTITITWPVVINGTQMPDFVVKLDFPPVPNPWWRFWRKNITQNLPREKVDLAEVES